MGWKSIKEHYRVGHSVQVTEQGICIGSPYIHDLIVIGLDGTIKKHSESGNEDLVRYMREFRADPEKLKSLAQAEDIFERSISVYTYDMGTIIEKQCEEPGWPNTTHDGEMMYSNTYSTDRAQVAKWAKQDLEAGIRLLTDGIARDRQKIAEREADLAEYEAALAKLTSD
jgi:hypothetical protein